MRVNLFLALPLREKRRIIEPGCVKLSTIVVRIAFGNDVNGCNRL
jgi:hypothetical protein